MCCFEGRDVINNKGPCKFLLLAIALLYFHVAWAIQRLELTAVSNHQTDGGSYLDSPCIGIITISSLMNVSPNSGAESWLTCLAAI